MGGDVVWVVWVWVEAAVVVVVSGRLPLIILLKKNKIKKNSNTSFIPHVTYRERYVFFV